VNNPGENVSSCQYHSQHRQDSKRTMAVLAMLAYVFLEEERDSRPRQWQRHVTIGEAQREIQRRHRRHVLDWLHRQFQSGIEPDSLYDLFSA